MATQPRLVTDQILEEYFLDIEVSKMMSEQRQLQLTIQATIKTLDKEKKRFARLKSPTHKHKSGVEIAKLKAILVIDQARLIGMVCAKESIDDYQGIPF